MASKIIKTVFQLRRATAAEWLVHKDVIPAAGEPCFVIDENILKIGDGETTFENLKPINGIQVEIAADGKSVVLEDNVFKLMGFDAAEVGAQPRKAADGTIEWIVPSTDTVEGLQASVAGLQSDVAKLQEIVGTDAGEDPLLTRVQTLEDAVEVLNSDDTVEGSVKKIVTDEINAFATKVTDDDVINSYKELIDYVADHGSEAATMAADITMLQALVGKDSVQDQISAAIAGKVDAEEGKSLVANELIAKLEGMDEGANANKIEAIKIGATLMDIVDKTVTIPLGAGLKGSDEIEIEQDGTLRIKAMSFDKLMEGDDQLVFDGGGAI